jgi:hypothetical protein
MQEYDPAEWYTSEVALKKLIENSGGKTIDDAYLRSLARQGKIEKIKLGKNFSIYNKAQTDAYKVGARGEKLPHNKKKKEETHERANERAE